MQTEQASPAASGTAPSSSSSPGAGALTPGLVTGQAVLSLKEKVGYALGDSASNFYWKVLEFFLLFFYTDVFGISPAAAATLLLVSRIWDAINDPVMGAIADRTRTRWGKFRPWLLWMAVPMAISAVAMFTVPDLGPGGKLAYAYLTYTLMMMVYTAINIPYSALMGVMTPVTQERSQLSSFRFIGAFGVALVVQTFTPAIAESLGGGDAAAGWQRVMMLYGSIAAVLFVACFQLTRERIQPSPQQRASLREDVGSLMQNGPWKLMFLLGLLVIAGFVLRGGTLMYYFKYYLKAPERFELFMFSGGLAALLGTMLMPLGCRLLGKRRLYALCMGSAGLLSPALYFLPPESWNAILTLNTLVAFLLGPTAPLMFVMFTDTADYGEWKTGRRNTGMVMAAAMLSLKFGGAIGGFANGMILDWTGFVANQEQSAEALNGILLIVGILPALTCTAAAILACFYRLDDVTLCRIELELKRRRAGLHAAGAEAESGAAQVPA